MKDPVERQWMNSKNGDWTLKGLEGVMLGNVLKVESSKALRTKATYHYLDNRMIHLQATVTISEQDIIPVSAVSQTCGYLIWEQGVPNPTNNNTVLPSRTTRAQDQRHYAASEWWVPRYQGTRQQTDVLFFILVALLTLFSFPSPSEPVLNS